jgi:hypothetical protein
MTDQAAGEQGNQGETTPQVIPVLPPENLVEQTIERAAQKVADGATTANGTPVLSRIESLAVVAVLAVLNLANLWVAVDNRSNAAAHRDDFKAVCQLIIEELPSEQNTTDLARRFAECLKD